MNNTTTIQSKKPTLLEFSQTLSVDEFMKLSDIEIISMYIEKHIK